MAIILLTLIGQNTSSNPNTYPLFLSLPLSILSQLLRIRPLIWRDHLLLTTLRTPRKCQTRPPRLQLLLETVLPSTRLIKSTLFVNGDIGGSSLVCILPTNILTVIQSCMRQSLNVHACDQLLMVIGVSPYVRQLFQASFDVCALFK